MGRLIKRILLTDREILIFISCYFIINPLMHVGWSWKSLEEWPQYLKLGIPGMIMICVEWVSFEVSAFIVGTIDEVELAVNGILLNYSLLLYTVKYLAQETSVYANMHEIITYLLKFCYGFSIAVSVRVGNELGAGNAQRAKRAALVAIGAIGIIMTCIMFENACLLTLIIG